MNSQDNARFNPPPGWPQPPTGWVPPASWTPDPNWPPLPEGWQLWINDKDVPQTAIDQAPSFLEETPKHTKASPSRVIQEQSSLEQLKAENDELRQRIATITMATSTSIGLSDDAVLQEVGVYRYHHPLENASAYKDRLHDLEERIKDLVKTDTAIVKSNNFTLDNSLAKGRRMSSDLAKLMLRAYNSEADNSLRTLRAGNVVTAKRRLETSRSTIARLGSLMDMRISDQFHKLRIEELELTADWLMKKQDEKDAQREERARLREERRVERELAEQREQLDKERTHLENTLNVLRRSGENSEELERRLSEIDDAIAQNDFRAANIRAGYVYVISNRGAFGADVVKIGLTRRLEPTERVAELSGASVPFRFDIHTIYFSEDAVSLENELHKHFADRALNRANPRKEFFFASPNEVREVLQHKVGSLLEFSETAEATEFLQSVQQWPTRGNIVGGLDEAPTKPHRLEE